MTRHRTRPICSALALALSTAFAIALSLAVALPAARVAHAHGPDAHDLDVRDVAVHDIDIHASDAQAADPPIPATTSLATWRYNHDAHRGAYRLSGGATGTNLADVQQLWFDAASIFVRATGIPAYDIGPFADGNPNVPGEQDYVYRLPLDAALETGTPRATGLGSIGTFVNGVPIYNALDDWSYVAAAGRDAPNMGGMGGQRGDAVWNRNAALAERRGFDACLGHPARGRAQGAGAANGRYHHHIDPTCLRAALGDDDVMRHSPIIGWAFDGFPLYGPYGYGDPNDPSSTVRRMRSSYRTRDIATRTTLPDGSAVPAAQAGPPVGGAFPLGWYVEDFTFAAGSGDLDAHNGRWTRTPEFPDGIYAYFTTLDDAGQPAYPYLVGPRYRGRVAADNIGPGGRVVVPTGAAPYIPPVATDVPHIATAGPSPSSTGAPSAESTPTKKPTTAPTSAIPTSTATPLAARCYLPWAGRLSSDRAAARYRSAAIR